MNSSTSGSNNPSTFSGAQTPPAAAQAFVPAGGAQTFTPAPAAPAPSFNGAQASQAVVSNRSAQTFTPAPAAPSFTAAQSGGQAQGANFGELKGQLDTAAKALKAFADALTEAMKQVSGDGGGVAQPASPQEQFRQGAVDEQQPAPVARPDNEFKPAPVPDAAAEPMSPVSAPSRTRTRGGGGGAPQAMPDAPQGDEPSAPSSPQRDDKGRFLPQGGGGGGGGGGMLGGAMTIAKRHPIAAAALAIGGFAFSQAGSTSINQALQGLPMGGMIAGSLTKLEELGMKGAEFELAALQSGMTRGQGQGGGYATSNASYASIKTLSTTLGISPSAAASMLRDVGSGSQGQLSVTDIAGLTVRGFDAAGVSALGGQLQAAGVGGAGTVLQTMGIARARGLSNAGVMSFAQATAGFATGRRMAGLDITDASLTARRARSMILPDEENPSLEANIATLGRFQAVGVSASKGLSGFVAGMSEQMLQAYAFEKAGGDIFKATAMLEDMSADPVAMREAMRAQGASDEQVDLALLGTGQLTTTDIRRGREGRRGAEAGRMATGVASTSKSLAASRAVAQKGQRDLEQLYGTEGGGGESVVSRFNTLLKAQTRYQAQVLKKMPTSAQIDKIVDKLISILSATDFLKSIANNLYGSSSAGAGKGTGVTNIQLGNTANTRVRVRGGTRF